MPHHHLIWICSIGLLAASHVYAGGPLAIEGSGGNTPVRYSPANIALNFDIGTLGTTRTNSQADALVLQGLALWNSVSTATVQLIQAGDLPVDIDVSNYKDMVPDGSPNHPSLGDNLNPVIYDHDGKIIDDIFGVDASDNIAGFAASVYFVGSDKYEEGYAVLNGKLSLSNTFIVSLVAHEIGHFIGLDHSQLDINNTETDSGTPLACSTASQNLYPLMYPFSCRVSSTLHPDEIAAVSALYPVTNIAATFGQINGVFVDVSGNPILGANLWVENTVSAEKYSIVSDYLVQNTGFFAIYLPPGTYTLHANSINPVFFDASSVGPYSMDAGDVSFQSPHPITAVDFEGATPGSAEIISITAGTGARVNFVVDGSGDISPGEIILPPTSNPASSSDSGEMSFVFTTLALTGVLLLRRRERH